MHSTLGGELVATGAHHRLGYTFVHEIAHLLRAIINDEEIAPHSATFKNRYRVNLVDVIIESAETRRQLDIKY